MDLSLHSKLSSDVAADTTSPTSPAHHLHSLIPNARSAVTPSGVPPSPTISSQPAPVPASHSQQEPESMKNTWQSANDAAHLPPLTIDAPSSPAQSKADDSSKLVSKMSAVSLAPSKPLTLLDLPVDILKDIIKEVTHTNDLTCLALCHSALHRLVIPHIYSRFDIVWPDSATPTEPRTGVDALTYGLATLVMAEDVFGKSRTATASADEGQRMQHSSIRRRRGNYYAQFTRKFSLGNGPTEWVQEYLITKEGGKMLGTLVALALARMRNLETFIWDMPTGILADVWNALSSLGDRHDGLPCRLHRIAVRFHDNSLEPQALPLHHPPPPGSLHPHLDHVEHPSFSILPPMKSLSVLDVDELQYLDELSVLIGRSQACLRELRVGIAKHMDADWTQVWEGDQVHQIDRDHPTASCLTVGLKRLGGILGVLTAFVSDMRRIPARSYRTKRLRRRSGASMFTHQPLQVPVSSTAAEAEISDPMPVTVADEPPTTIDTSGQDTTLGNDSGLAIESPRPLDSALLGTDEAVPQFTEPIAAVSPTSASLMQAWAMPSTDASIAIEKEDLRLSGKLSLDILELERVPLSIPVLQNVIDWTNLTSLTLLQCPNHEHLWKTLRRLYSPAASNPRQYARSDPSRGSKAKAPKKVPDPSEYRLKLTKIHTDTVSSSLVTFIKETLQPNTLQVLFLQESSRSDAPAVTIDSIYRNVLRKHRNSLKKVLIDSSDRRPDGGPVSFSRCKRWMLTRDMLAYIMNGKMPALRELGATLDYRDWHYFLQHLPCLPHLRSLYIPHMANYIHGGFITEPRELALQIVDIVSLRPDIELCYIGIAKKCFEILENLPEKDQDSASVSSTTTGEGVGSDPEIDEDEDDVENTSDDDDDDHSQHSSSGSTEPADSDTEDDPVEEQRSEGVHLSLREILYYDDKVTIFKARHGRL